MRLGYCSPFNPMQSGISDFSEELIFALAEQMEVVVFSPVEVENKAIREKFEVHPLSELDDAALRGSLDQIVYHLGNNSRIHSEIVKMLHKYPGVVELHDFGMHHFAAEYYLGQNTDGQGYLDLARYCHGERGLSIAQAFLAGKGPAPWETHPLDMSMNKRYIDEATGIIVHSPMLKDMVIGCRPQVPVTVIMHHSADLCDDPQALQKECRAKLGLPEELRIFGSFGFAQPNKRILPILDALERYHKEWGTPFRYYIVGKPDPKMELPAKIAERGLTDNVVITGFTTLEEFKLYMGACDFCLNLRYPTMGETSGSLHRMMGLGKPVVVTAAGTFRDYPDSVALKVRYGVHEVEDIYKAICLLTNNRFERDYCSLSALKFARQHCDIHKNAILYKQFFEQVQHGWWEPSYEDLWLGRLSEGGL